MSARRLALACLAVGAAGSARADPALDALVAAYPDHLASADATHLVWRDGTRMPLSGGRTKTSAEALDDPDLDDQFRYAYPLGPLAGPPTADPGRIRYDPLFRKMYGDCRAGGLKGLVRVPWLPGRGGGSVMFSGVNGAARALAAVSDDLEKLPVDLTPFLAPSAGTVNCRPIAGTNRLSAHGYGIAIDLNPKFGDYWRWAKGGVAAYRNRVPYAIAEAFERHGFIWGGKWRHFDTFHFEYRPELLRGARRDPA